MVHKSFHIFLTTHCTHEPPKYGSAEHRLGSMVSWDGNVPRRCSALRFMERKQSAVGRWWGRTAFAVRDGLHVNHDVIHVPGPMAGGTRRHLLEKLQHFVVGGQHFGLEPPDALGLCQSRQR